MAGRSSYPLCVFLDFGGILMDISIGDKLKMKKKHPCGSEIFIVSRAGMDFKIRCEKCGHEIMLPRIKLEKNIKQVIKEENDVQ